MKMCWHGCRNRRDIGKHQRGIASETARGDTGKISTFSSDISEATKKSRYLPIHELLYEIFAMTGYLDYVTALPAGGQRGQMWKC